ncbi:alpha/beta fold hydrolase [Paractinoplanes hotanensis]|uniref:Alpha/beta fold hydrolase n=1 Tax=Paractinoplanes hotanensis TaxID=2906497 RepID=A0ABT0Y5Z8_9ACTN|nr:alpha/beta fold hydrolase [Actinoplanes hotanensis]MCM4081441.1 alpha/beta fold hydrolase [Actinoplanes hotanensis]
MSRLLIVHGTGGPARTDASVRLEWITSIQDGLALAGHPAGRPDATVVNLDAPGRGEPAAGSDPAAEARLLRRCWQAATFDTEPGSEPAATAALAARLAWSRYFCGMTPDELITTLRRTRAYAAGAPAGRRAADEVRAALTPETEIVIGHCLGGVAAAAALAGSPPGVRALVTLGSPHPVAADAPAGATTWVDVTDVQDTLVLAAGADPAGVTDRVSLDCDPRLRGARNYLASPEFGKILGSLLEATPGR